MSRLLETSGDLTRTLANRNKSGGPANVRKGQGASGRKPCAQAPLRILCVEDDPGCARLIQRHLERIGYEVHVATDGEEAVSMWDAHRYDLVTIDYDIPRKDGLEVIKSLAAREPLPTMIMISGAGNEKVAVEALSLGAADYLIKDTEAGYLELLPSVIHQALEKRRVLSEKLRSERERDRLIHELQLRQAELEAQREELRKSHSELEKWAARYADLYDNPPVGFLTLNREGVILEGNLAGARILGAERDLLVGESLSAFVCPDDRETYVNHLKRAMESGERELCEIRLLSDGNPLVLLDSRRSLDAEGKYSQCHIAISDVTHFRRTQRALHESEERYRSLVDLSPDGIIVYDEKGIIIFSNPAACEILRCTPDGMLGIPISDLISQDSKEIEIKRMQEALEIGTIPSFVEEKWVRFDGSTVDVEVGSVSIVYDGLPAFQTVVRDITERKNAERALRQGEERLELVLMGADLGSWDCDLRSGTAVFDHQWAKMLGYSPEELEASVGAWMYRIHPDDVPEVVSALKDHLLGATPIFESEHRLRTKGGEWKWFLSRGKIVERDEHGWPVRMTGTQHDVTERKHAQELLADRSRELSERVKELNCLYGISKIVEDPNAPQHRILQEIANLIPTGFRYPDVACARIKIDGAEFISETFQDSPWELQSLVEVNGKSEGVVQVRYLEERPEADRGPFSKEEQQLLDAIAERLGRIIEQFRARIELKESEERFRTIFETAMECMFLKDPHLRFTLVNQATERLFGMKASEIVGRRSEDIFDQETALYLNQIDMRVLGGETVEEERIVPIRGEPLILHQVRAPLRNARGEIVGLCGIMRNVTERKKLVREPHTATAEDYPSPAMHRTLEKARIAAETDSIVLLQGESGSGKDYLARWTHDHSPRAAGPFFAINCAAVAKELAESELFGHERGAFTGANSQKRGLLELAEGGTILLNEIGELDLSVQSKLLAFLDTRSFLRVGGEKHVRVNARLIAASHRDLHVEVEEGRFLRPLFYRLSVFPIQVPPLRERIEDLPVLVRDILSGLASDMQLSSIPEIDSGHIAALARYHWPGNIRELRNVLERSLILWEGGRFHLALPTTIESQEEVAPMLLTENRRNLEDIVNDAITLACKQALAKAGGNKTEAAEMLGISRGAFYRYLKRVGIEYADRTQDRAQSRHGKPGLDRGNRVREECVAESRTDSG